MEERRRGLVDELQVPVPVAAQRGVAFAGLDQPAPGVVADRLEQPEAGLARAGIREDERLLDEPAEEVEDVELVDGVAEQTASAASRGAPAAKTDSRRRTARSGSVSRS